MRVRLGEATMVPDDFRSTDTVRFPTCLDGLRKHFLDITRVLDTTDIDFRRHSICGAEMDAADTAQTLIEVLLECDVPDAVQLNLILAQVKAARQGQTVFRTKIARPTLCAHLVYGLQQADATPIIANSGSNTAPGAYLMSPLKKDYLDCAADTLNKTSLSEQCIGTMSIWF